MRPRGDVLLRRSNDQTRRGGLARYGQVMTLWVLPFASIVLVVALGLGAWLPWAGTGGSTAAPTDQLHAHHGHAAHTHGAGGAPVHQDYFTNFGHYMARTGCLSTATGEPDWPWIVTLIVLNAGIVIAYLRIYIFWTRSYLAEERRDRNGKLMDLAQVFLWCAICGYAAGIVMFFWPAYRLTAVCLLILNIWSWRFAFNLKSFKVAFSARRYQRLASSDALTGLPNRLAIRQHIDRLLVELHEGRCGAFAVLFLDFDRFKLINDTMGHEVGDQLLKAIAQRLGTACRADDQIAGGVGESARLGGDEFVVVLPGVDKPQTALAIAERLVDRFTPAFMLEERKVRSTPSIGVVVVQPSYLSADQVLRDADVAMYAAKADERRAAVLFDQAMLERVAERMELETDLHQAVAEDQFVLHYQPLIDLESGGVEGFEALIRWAHPQRGMVRPDLFISIAEEIGLISEIGRWVFQTAAKQLADWSHDPAFAQCRMHINVAANQLYDETLADTFIALAAEAGVCPSRVVLEVTESMFVSDIESATVMLNRLKEAGFAIAMDDFGTGYSSLSVLHRFPIDELKIDRAFINNMAGRTDYAAVLHAITSLAENLGIAVIAEGIETPEQLAQLQALGCGLAQGYLFSRPIPAEQVAEWAAGWTARRRASA